MKRSFVLCGTLLLAACNMAPVTDDGATSSSSEAAAEAFSRTTVTMDKANSELRFTGKSNIINHEGVFENFDVTLTPDASDPSDLEDATVAATIDLTSAVSDPGVTGHLQKEDFFDTAKYPEATFTSTGIQQVDENVYDITGDFTMKGVTKEITINAEITNDGMTVTFGIPRKEFGVGNDSYGDKMLEEMVPVEGDIVFMN